MLAIRAFAGSSSCPLGTVEESPNPTAVRRHLERAR